MCSLHGRTYTYTLARQGVDTERREARGRGYKEREGMYPHENGSTERESERVGRGEGEASIITVSMSVLV